MLTTLLILMLSINGGLYVGTILHSASQMARLHQAVDFYQSIWSKSADR
jgi:hypothetical protein